MARLPADLQRAIKQTVAARDGAAVGQLASGRGAPVAPDVKLLRRSVLGASNPERAGRAFVALRRLQAKHPRRLSDAIVGDLVEGVGRARTSATAGREGVLGVQAALRAAQAIIAMRSADAHRLALLLSKAGASSKRPRGASASPSTERALILKAVAARHDALAAAGTRRGGRASAPMSAVSAFARAVRGKARAWLIERSTVLDLDGDSTAEALQQRFKDSCGPTAVQMARAESDPIYALKLHRETIHTLATTGSIAAEQKRELEHNGGVAAARGTTARGEGMATSRFDGLIAKALHRTVSSVDVVPDSAVRRRAALDRVAKALRGGADVPLIVVYPGGVKHALLLSDVRGAGAKQRFLVSDPWKGDTRWVSARDIIAASDKRFGRLVATFR